MYAQDNYQCLLFCFTEFCKCPVYVSCLRKGLCNIFTSAKFALRNILHILFPSKSTILYMRYKLWKSTSIYVLWSSHNFWFPVIFLRCKILDICLLCSEGGGGWSLTVIQAVWQSTIHRFIAPYSTVRQSRVLYWSFTILRIPFTRYVV